MKNAKDEDVAYVVNNGMELTVDNLAKQRKTVGKMLKATPKIRKLIRIKA